MMIIIIIITRRRRRRRREEVYTIAKLRFSSKARNFMCRLVTGSFLRKSLAYGV